MDLNIIGNIWANLPSADQSEVFETVLSGRHVRIERIVSDGHCTPAGEWYDQTQDEWVLLLSGSAGLLLEAVGEEIRMLPGDHLLLAAGCRHRVVWTDPQQKTVWLAVHFGEGLDHGSN